MIGESLIKELYYREASNSPIKIAIAGAGFLGRGLINQISLMKGIRVSAIANRNPEKALTALSQAKLPYRHRLCRGQEDLRRALLSGETGVVDDPLLLAAADVDIILDCTGSVEVGASLGLAAIEQGKHFITNAEADATVGFVLNKKAREKGLVYSGVDGDEPGVAMRLYRYVSLLGLDIVAAGKFKKFYDRFATPESIRPWAERYRQNPFMIASFTDGTKLSFEMTQLSNATGLVPEVRGMNCPRATLDTVAEVLRLREQGGILNYKGVVEVVQDVEPSGGVFVVASTSHPDIMQYLHYLKMGDGPNYLFYRPYHLCTIEMPATIIIAALSGEATIAPQGMPVAETLAVAKRDLLPGEVLDGIGRYTFYGLIDKARTVREEKLLPAGLAQGARVLRPIKRDQPISLDDVEVNYDSDLWKLRKQQESLFPL
ncbi:MAG: NAD(P)H-dependent oxidoreductase [Bacillota bacterium]